MSVIVSTSEIILEKDNAGVLYIGKTRVPLDTVVFAFNEGATPEEIVWRYPTLDLTQVYAAISYYLQNRSEVEIIWKREPCDTPKLKPKPKRISILRESEKGF